MPKIKGYRTYAAAAVTILLGISSAVGLLDLDSNVMGAIMVVIGAVVAALRTVTDTPPGSQ